jgi:8-oxo-dGTP pyrophosphatase MutT (NUDIX family)
MKITTLCFLLREDEVLLAMKKRGFGVGKYNGAGGKVKEGETLVGSVIREVREELGVEVAENDLTHRATLAFSFEGKDDWSQVCEVFVSSAWQGEPSESEEMKPAWFPVQSLPFDKMWIDDPIWLPQVLRGETIKASFYFNGDGSRIIKQNLEI